MKPIVDGLEERSEGQLQIIRLDFLSPLGRATAWKYRVWLIPALLLFDGEGREIKRQLGLLNPAEISQALSPGKDG